MGINISKCNVCDDPPSHKQRSIESKRDSSKLSDKEIRRPVPPPSNDIDLDDCCTGCIEEFIN